jgi:AraC-like DNA-binding protein
MISIGDPDAIVRLAERCPAEASKAIAACFSKTAGKLDWPDLLAASLRKSASFSISHWARRHGLTPETVSRGFRHAYGTTPRRYLAEARTRRAWIAVSAGTRSLADIALDLGFADQAHMTRSLTGMTGLPPGKWRRRGQVGSRPASA